MKLMVVVSKDDIDADPAACSSIERLCYEHLHVRSVNRITPRTHYEYGEPVYIELEVALSDGFDDYSDEIADLEDVIVELKDDLDKANKLIDELQSRKESNERQNEQEQG